MVIPSVIISILYAYNTFNFRSLALDATLVIAVTFLGSTIAAIVMPWRQKEVFEGSPIAKIRMPDWLGYLMTVVYAAGSIYLIYVSGKYALTVIGGLPQVEGLATPLTWAIVILVALLTLINAVVLLWILYYVGKRIFAGAKMPLVTLAGFIFLLFLDWLLIVWFWDPFNPPFDFALYAIGWKNVSSMVFMVVMYVLAAAIYFGFSAYRRRQGIDIDKVYKEIPVE
jgi:hypothetical protein